MGGSIAADGVTAEGFAYGRDPVPHVPPRFFGYRSTQLKLFHIMKLDMWSSDQFAQYVDHQGSLYDIEDILAVKRVYLNTVTTFHGDKMFASARTSFKIGDHMQYFMFEGAKGCGMDVSEKFLAV